MIGTGPQLAGAASGPTIPLGFGTPEQIGETMLEDFLIPFEAASHAAADRRGGSGGPGGAAARRSPAESPRTTPTPGAPSSPRRAARGSEENV